MSAKRYSHDDYKVGWICALPKEQTAAIAMLDERHDSLKKPLHDSNAYTLGSISGHNVVIACLPVGDIGTNSAANVATQMVNTFPSIRFGLMVGIGGGIPPKVKLGDVVISQPTGGFPGVVQWDLGKTESGDQPVRTGSLDRPPKALLTALTKLKSEHEMNGHKIQQFLDQMAKDWPRLKSHYTWSTHLKDPLYSSDTRPGSSKGSLGTLESKKSRESSIHYGLIASGNQVIKDGKTRDKIDATLNGEVLCVEMEAAGLMNHFPCIVIRGICDYADSRKNKHWQEYAAAVAAAFAKEFLGSVDPTDVEGEKTAVQILNQIQNDISDTRDGVIYIQSRIDKEADRNLLEWLTQVDYNQQHNTFYKKSQPGTGQWLLGKAEFQSWMSESKKTLLCQGFPGAGKTILTSVVINHLQINFVNNTKVGMAYIYCHYKQQDIQDFENLLASLLKQLLYGQSYLPEDIADFMTKHEEKRTRPSADELITNIKSVLKLYDTAFIIIDAMDECQLPSLKRFLFSVFDLQKRFDIRIFATTRPISDIKAEFFCNVSNVSLIEVRASTTDVMAFVDHQMHSLPNVVRRDDQLQEEIKRKISVAVDGMFLLAEIYITLLRDKTTPNEIVKALEEFQMKNQGRDENHRDQALTQAYEQVMERINGQGSGLRTLAMGALSWITLAKRNLTVVELQHALATKQGSSKLDEGDLPDLRDISSVCAGLVTVDENSNVIRLVHNTAQEYFERTKARWFPNAEAAMSKTCITYISFNVFGDGFTEEKWYYYGGEQYPFYKYAVNNWTHGAPENVELSTELEKLLNDQSKITLAVEKLHTNSSIITSQYSTSAPKNTNGLHFAVFFGVVKVVEKLLEHGFKPDHKDSCGRTPLWWASQGGQDAIVKLLLDAGALLETKDRIKGYTPLMCAIHGEHQKVVDLLLDKRIEIDTKNNQGQTALIMASEIGAENIVQLLIKKGKADVNLRDSGEKCWTPLLWAIENGHNDAVKMLLEAGADVKVKNGMKMTPLQVATKYDDKDIVQLLLKAGADAGERSKGQMASLVVAAPAQSNVQQLISLDPGTLLTAVQFQRVEILRLLQNAGADMKQTDEHGWTLLFHAAHRDKKGEIIHMLLNGLINVNARDKSGKTALFIAVDCRDESRIFPPLNRTSSFGAPGAENRIPYIYTNHHSNPVAIQYLLRGGADVNARDGYDRTPLLYAILYSMLNIIRLLIDDGADVNARDKNEWTPLYTAVYFGRDNVVKLLLDTGKVDMEAKYSKPKALLSLAKEKGNDNAVQLIEAWVKINNRRGTNGTPRRFPTLLMNRFTGQTTMPWRRAIER